LDDRVSDKEPPAQTERREAIEFLIEQERALFEAEDQRRDLADGLTAFALTAALTLAGLSVTLANQVDESKPGAQAAFAVVAFSAGLAVIMRAVSGYFHRRRTWFSTHSQETSAAIKALRALERKWVPGTSALCGPWSMAWLLTATQRRDCTDEPHAKSRALGDEQSPGGRRKRAPR